MEQILHTLHEFVWSPGMLAFFLLTGIYFTVQSKFYSILRIRQWFGQTLGSLFKKPQVRNTKETQIRLQLNIDGTGSSDIDTGIGFFDHMLDGFTRHGLYDLTQEVQALSSGCGFLQFWG